MGIRNLYTHLSPYARPEVFESSASKTAIFIDGPALCHHVYHLIFCAGSTIGGNAFEATLSYHTFALAFGSYLARLEVSGFEIKKILFDSALPIFKTSTRLSRLGDSLNRLSRYRSGNSVLRHGAQPVIEEPSEFFSKNSTTAVPFTSQIQHLSAPPFIVAAALSWLAANDRYREATETVAGEADPFLAAVAIQQGGVVLTGDSDLLVFSGEGEKWGVMMLQDLVFTAAGVTARVFRPTQIAKTLKYPLLEVAYEVLLDPHASLSQILDRLERIKERRKQGVGMQKIPRDFIREYTLPPCEEGRRLVKEPRIGELLFLAAQGAKQERRMMYFPFLLEDPQRAPAWEIGASIRGLAYTLLFGYGEVMEVFRRGTRITGSSVECVFAEKKLQELGARIDLHPESWWVSTILDEICDAAGRRSKPPPSSDELTTVTSSLLPPNPVSTPTTTIIHQKWNWGLIHVYAMAQAGWYSLLLLGEVLVFLSSGNNIVNGNVEHLQKLREGLLRLPDVLKLFDGRAVLSGVERSDQLSKELGKAALARYWRVYRAAESDGEVEAEAEAEAEATEVMEAPEACVNENGKRRGGDYDKATANASAQLEDTTDQWPAVESKGTMKRKKEYATAAAVASNGNKFALLTVEM